MRLSYIDLSQAESRVVGAIATRLFGDQAYLDAQESGDPHTLVCSMCWRKLSWPSDFNLTALQAEPTKKFPKDILHAAKAIANQIAYRDMSYRDLAKRLSHGSNYGGQPATMAVHSHVEVPIIVAFQDEYFGGFPAIKRWQDWVKETIQGRRELTTMLGRRVFVFKDPKASSTIREMIAYEPQSVGTGDYMNEAVRRLDAANLPLHLLQQVHDAVSFEYDRRDENWLIPHVTDIISWKFPLTPQADVFGELLQAEAKGSWLSRQQKEDLARLKELEKNPRMFSIPAEAMVGWNLRKQKVKKDGTIVNPNGLVDFNPVSPDLRRRISSAPLSITERLAITYQHR